MIDLRSDTVTKPNSAMLDAMREAELGDDVYGEDPTVNALEAYAAELGLKEAALFLPTATQSNLSAILSHCARGDEYLVGDQAHCYRWEGGGAAVLGSVQPQPIPFEADATLDLNLVKANIKPDDPHFARSRLLCLENTHMGKALPYEYLQAASQFCKEEDLSFHLDGARVFNACTTYGRPLSDVIQAVDSVTLCLSKGLGCPAGALLLGSKEFIYRARRWRKSLGGGMRQTGVLAAAGLYALQNHLNDLEEDHKKAKRLAEWIGGIATFQTNMVFFSIDNPNELRDYLRSNGVRILTGYTENIRLVCHRDVSMEQIEKVGELILNFMGST